MIEQQAKFIFKLRRNIELEGDLLLARMELASFFEDRLQDVPNISSLITELGLSVPNGFEKIDAHVRPRGQQAFFSYGPLQLLPALIRRISFVQHIYCVTEDTEQARILLAEIEKSLGPVVNYVCHEGLLVIQAVPHYTLFELSEVIARKSTNAREAIDNLQAVLNTLVNKPHTIQGEKLANAALSAQLTTSHLTHGIHYYKAKFFPRMARSVLNICLQSLGTGKHKILDNFVGSGTTLLEASTLGVPSVGLDIDPLSVLISKAKLEALTIDPDLFSSEAERMQRVLSLNYNLEDTLFSRAIAPQEAATIACHPEITRDLAFPTWLLKNRKMTATIIDKLTWEISLARAAVAQCNPCFNNIFRVLLSDAIANRIHMRFLGTGVGRFSLTFSKSSIPEILMKTLQYYTKVVSVNHWLIQTLHIQLAEAQVYEADARQIPFKPGQFDILLTSPPYLPASSGRETYTKARALSFIALGMKTPEDIDNLIDYSVGSMEATEVQLDSLTKRERDVVEWLQHDGLRALKAMPTARYFLDMRKAFREMYRVLSPNALAVVVSGKKSTFYEFSTRKVLYTVPSAELLAEEAQRVGFEVVALHDVQLNKLNMNARPRSLDDYYETLIVLRKT